MLEKEPYFIRLEDFKKDEIKMKNHFKKYAINEKEDTQGDKSQTQLTSLRGQIIRGSRGSHGGRDRGVLRSTT